MQKKYFKSLIFFLLIGGLIYRYFFYIDVMNGCFIRLKPSIFELSSTNIKEGIRILKRVTPEEYDNLCKYVKIINPNYACGGLGGGCYYSSKLKQKEIDISTANGSFLGQTAAVIAHEACHAAQHQEGRPMSEQECHEVDDNVFKQVAQY